MEKGTVSTLSSTAQWISLMQTLSCQRGADMEGSSEFLVPSEPLSSTIHGKKGTVERTLSQDDE